MPYGGNMANKYYAKPTMTSDGMAGSKKEAKRLGELKLLQNAGVISNLRFQVRYQLLAPQYEEKERFGKNGQPLKPSRKLVERGVDYVADFVYEQDGRVVVEDAKGYKKGAAYALFVIKRKLMLMVHGIKIREV
jgi:hypothetical protein